jgi:hypothetical protein
MQRINSVSARAMNSASARAYDNYMTVQRRHNSDYWYIQYDHSELCNTDGDVLLDARVQVNVYSSYSKLSYEVATNLKFACCQKYLTSTCACC